MHKYQVKSRHCKAIAVEASDVHSIELHVGIHSESIGIANASQVLGMRKS